MKNSRALKKMKGFPLKMEGSLVARGAGKKTMPIKAI